MIMFNEIRRYQYKRSVLVPLGFVFTSLRTRNKGVYFKVSASKRIYERYILWHTIRIYISVDRGWPGSCISGCDVQTDR